ncbi:MAG: hypothetical protein B7O98_06765 [Zestosphaera tikiterensis]|uniref:FAD-binding domain-containing protein n=1 Tax=Zestosphaera tikiterensis TaxID=1973259 RepID=A0A2R7Y476_9CREN|nr:MAG: hypothetical protein B7O98_06765 [Zestosphaera tikiterensis]
MVDGVGSKVCVVGGGPAGLLSSYVLVNLGFEVSIFEEHREVGIPRHCSGMLSDYVVSSLSGFVKDCVVGRFRSYALILDTHSSFKEVSTLTFNEYVYAVDREKLEKNVYEVLTSSGVDVRLKNKVMEISFNPLRITLESGKYETCDYVVVGEGAVRRLSKSLGFCKSVKNAFGLQAVIKTSKTLEVPYVVLSKFFDKDSFGWVIPLENKEALVGVISRNNLRLRLAYLIKKFLRYEGLRDLNLINVFGGLIPLDTPCSTVIKEHNVIAVGDAASMIKPISKGGLYPITLSIQALRKSVRRGDIDLKLYVENMKSIVSKLRTQHIVKDVVMFFGGYYNLVKLLNEFKVREVKVLKYDDLVLKGMSLISKR